LGADVLRCRLAQRQPDAPIHAFYLASAITPRAARLCRKATASERRHRTAAIGGFAMGLLLGPLFTNKK